MTVADEVRVSGIGVERRPVAIAAPRKPPFWQQRAFYRYGFLVLILTVWELVGPLVSPIFFPIHRRLRLRSTS